MREAYFGKTGSRLAKTKKHENYGMNHHALIFAVQRDPALR